MFPKGPAPKLEASHPPSAVLHEVLGFKAWGLEGSVTFGRPYLKQGKVKEYFLLLLPGNVI